MNLYDGIDTARLMYGENARHVPVWMYVQDGGNGMVTFVGASNVGEPHPLRYGSVRTHQFIVGEVIVRPHLVVATDTLRGLGLAGLAMNDHDIPAMLRNGEKLMGAHR